MNSELLYITKKLGYPSSFGTRAGLGDFLDQYPDGVYAENGGGAPTGWKSAAVWFGGDSERAAARFERMMSERNELSRLFRTRVSGVLVLTFIYRLKSRMVTAIPIIGGQPQPIDPTWLYFTMPQGGTVSLTKIGTPTEVTLEYSLDNGNTWTEWVENENVRSLTLLTGQTMHIRNTSEISTGFSTFTTRYYTFSFSADTYAGGDLRSLLCKNSNNASSAERIFCFYNLFKDATNLISAKIKLLFNDLPRSFYRSMFHGCSNLIEVPETITATTCYSGDQQCYSMFFNCPKITKLPRLTILQLSDYCYGSIATGCSNLNYVYTEMTDISARGCISGWLSSVSLTGDFYCSAELTIPTGVSGIPSDWTRHDI